MVTFDYSKLRGRIIEKFGTQSTFARRIGLSDRSLSLKMNNKVPFSQPEIKRMIDLLGADDEEIPILFFNDGVQKNEQADKPKAG